MNNNKLIDLRMLIYTALFTALIVIGGYLSFPLPFSPVPIVLSDFFVMLTGLFLGPAWGAAGVGIFLFMGLIGVPVFAGGNAGLAHYLGPRGGFLTGFLIAVIVIGLIIRKGKQSIIRDLIAMIAANAIIYGVGVPWLKVVLKCTWDKALALGFLPFTIGMVIKIIVAVAIMQLFRPLIKKYIPSLDRDKPTT